MYPQSFHDDHTGEKLAVAKQQDIL